MPSDTTAPDETQRRSVENVRERLLRFLRLVAKDVVRRLADAESAGAPGPKEPQAPRQNP